MHEQEKIPPAASVVVCAYKSRQTITRCLEALSSQETSLAYEVIVVESSGDGTGDLIRERFPRVRLIESPHRLFLGAAKNVGAEAASAELVLFIDSDCVAEAAWLDKICKALTLRKCAAVGGAILNGNPETPVSVAAYISEFSHLFPVGRSRRIDYLPGGNAGYRADVFRAYGGFEFTEPLYVDLMLGKRLSASGEKLLFEPDIRVMHWHRDSLKEHVSHQIKRGRAAALARRRGLLIGKSWIKYPGLALLVTPGLFARKAVVFTLRFARAFPLELGALIRALPYFLLGMAYWHYGFLKEVLQPTKAQAEQEMSAECTSS